MVNEFIRLLCIYVRVQSAQLRHSHDYTIVLYNFCMRIENSMKLMNESGYTCTHSNKTYILLQLQPLQLRLIYGKPHVPVSDYLISLTIIPIKMKHMLQYLLMHYYHFFMSLFPNGYPIKLHLYTLVDSIFIFFRNKTKCHLCIREALFMNDFHFVPYSVCSCNWIFNYKNEINGHK